ncbi:magnesium transporter CorA family protein [uncultured Clostridium sp.]|jgi:magnesium transporter|uniref:magnesium transporter CorA family protein n=1 Tax=uncultured Clostridium sp. TaxID=59620 RepID=UPI00263994BC|nr:magnesium transporter CorA family protein [uncultured Clostridium sp.]
MIQIFKSDDAGLLNKIDKIETGSWINLINPTREELDLVLNEIEVEPEFLSAALDEEESSRIDIENNETLLIFDIPYSEENDSGLIYDTYPLGIIYTDQALITVSLKETDIIKDFIANKISSFYTFKKFRFILQILYRVASYYLLYLRQIEKKSIFLEKKLNKTMKNEGLIRLHSLEKSLVYFSTSLKGNQVTLDKLLKLERIQKYEEDKELLDDVIIENKQAIEMTDTYAEIISSTMEYFSSVISNNFNSVAKILTSITTVMTIYGVVASTYGMNIPLPLQNYPHAFSVVLIATTLFTFFIIYLLNKKNMLK